LRVSEAIFKKCVKQELTRSKDCLKWFEIIHEYTWAHFKDKEYPEWYGYLNRQGEVLLSLKGGKWKGCFHVPRGLYQCWKTLEKINPPTPHLGSY
jgi:N-acylglucosamine 2-epimerase